MTPTVDGSIGASSFSPPPAQRDSGWGRRELGRGEALYRAGDVGGLVYRIEEGLLKLVIDGPGGRERILSLAGPGDLIGSIGPLEQSFRETAESLSQARVSALPLTEFMVDSSEELLAAAAKRLDHLRVTLEESELPVAMRVARILLRLGCRFGHRSDDGWIRLTLPLTHDHLAAMAGAARETTSTALGEIRKAGLLEGTRGRYYFEPARLESFVHELS
ncbi:MAG TPA: Crp/Fnr family transcriptional regulator [Trueperaceae bacterium]